MPPDENRIPRQLGHAVRRLRISSGLSQIALAEKAELNHNFDGKIERGEKFASDVAVVRITSARGLTGSGLLNTANL